MFSLVSKIRSGSAAYQPVNDDIIRAYNKTRPAGPQKLLCYVPFSSLTISWQGRIYACTYNRNILVGQYPQDRLRDIWFGDRIRKLRDHIEHDDLSYGCQHCRYFLEKKKFTGLKPQSFDKYHDYAAYQYPRVMEFEMSNKCNLECIMCNGNTSSAIRQNRDKLPALPMPYDDAFIEQLREFVPHLREAKFFGGEPFLIPSYFQIWDLMMELNPTINIFAITNGTVLTDKIKNLLARGQFEIAVSIDSIQKDRYETIRKNADFETVMRNLDYFNAYTQSRGHKMSLSFTTQMANWDELPQVIDFCNRKDIVFFNSFLTAPHDLSLIYQPSEKLSEIYSYLSGHTLPSGTELERYNKSCFDDYLKYIQYYQHKNENGIDHSEQKDNYEGDEWSGYHLDTPARYQTRQALYADIYAHQSADYPAAAAVQCLEVLFASLPDTYSQDLLLGDISRAPIAETIAHLAGHTIEELCEQVQKQYCR